MREVIDSEGWFHTGDIGRVDADGFLYVTGRIKDLIVLGGGKKVHPEEVEACLIRTLALKEVCVLGRIAKNGLKEGTEEVYAVIVPSDSWIQQYKGKGDLLEEELQKEIGQLAKGLASYKRPSRVILCLEELPKTATRKVKRGLVQQWIDQQEAKDVPP